MAHRQYAVKDGHRLSGLSPPWDPLQVVSWGLIATFAVFFYVFNGLFFRPPSEVALSIVYGCLVGSIVTANILTAHSNAADPGIQHKLTDQEIFSRSLPGDRTLCQLCRAYVDRSSKHCGRCNKCVIGFDHHCKWLNNCVGRANYRLFLSFVCLTLTGAMFHFAIALFQFIDSFRFPAYYAERQSAMYGTPLLVIYRACVGFIAGLAFLAAALLLHLLGFHAMLARRRLTTYEWILARRAQREASMIQEDPKLDTHSQGANDGMVARRRIYDAVPLPGAVAEPEASTAGSSPPTGDNESPSTGSAGRSSSSHSTARANRKQSASRMVHHTPKSSAHDSGLRLSNKTAEVAVDMAALEGGEAPVPPHLPPPPHLRAIVDAAQREGGAASPAWHSSSISGPASLASTSPRLNKDGCCGDVTDMMLSHVVEPPPITPTVPSGSPAASLNPVTAPADPGPVSFESA